MISFNHAASSVTSLDGAALRDCGDAHHCDELSGLVTGCLNRGGCDCRHEGCGDAVLRRGDWDRLATLPDGIVS
jgi:hypothetical protein